MFRSKWWRFVPFLPLVVLLCGVNVYADAGNIFHSPIDAVVSTLLSGYPAYVESRNLPERELCYRYICRMSDDIECIILGGSTAKTVSSFDVGEAKFANLGETNGRIDDAIALLGVLRSLGKHKHIKRIIFTPQEWYFSRLMFEQDDNEAEREALMPYTNYMMNVIDGKDTSDVNIPEISFTANSSLLDITFSLAYFQANISYITGSYVFSGNRFGIMNDQYEGHYYMPDGSRVYGKNWRERDEHRIIRFADKDILDREQILRYVGHIDTEQLNLFAKLVEYLLARGITVELYLCPISPALWGKLDPNKYPFFTELEDCMLKLAEKYSLRVIGSYNPYKVGITNADYKDTRHIHRESTSKYFNFKPVVND